MGLYVGTSGWAYKEWKPGFYPAELPQSRFLEHYGTVLNACEINATYHRRQERSTLEKWADAVPEKFRFAVKGHRAITPRADDPNPLREFSASMGALGPKLAVLFFQFPLKRDGNEEAFTRFLSAIEWPVPPVFDLKHESWHTSAIEKLVAASGGTMCHTDRDGDAPDALPPGDVAYVRLRTERYDDDQRRRWKELLRREAGERDVFAFAKHESAPAGDPSRGVGLAQWLLDGALR